MAKESPQVTRHIYATSKKAKEGSPFAWARWRASRLVHYRLIDRARIPPRECDCTFDYKCPRAKIAQTLRAVRAELRG